MASNLNYRYYVVFVDDCTRSAWIDPMKHKYEVFQHFYAFQRLVDYV